MRKYVLILVVVAMLPAVTNACDICGCGVGNNYIGILPDFNKKILGLRYRYNSLFTHLGVGGESTYLTTREMYKTVEAWGGYNISSSFRIMASVPYSFNEKINQGKSTSKHGLGDISVSAFYQLLNNRRTDTAIGSKLIVQSLWIGVGIKLPTGNYDPADKASTNNNANLFQLGTGSTDFNISAMYDIRLQDAGFNVASSYKINTANKYGYHYGNKFTVTPQAYYKFRVLNKVTIAPNTGVQYETALSDLEKGFNVTVSGGNLLLGTAGIETSFDKIAIGANYQTPLSQNLGKGIVKANDRIMVHVAIAL